MRLAFERAGANCVFTSEWDLQAQKTYSANFSGDIHGDIQTIEPSEIPDHDILVAGFPCQPFSIAGVSKKNSLGRPHGFLDKTQGTLFFSVANIIDAKRPRAFLLENVKHLVRHDRGWTFRVILDVLENDLGYTVFHTILNAANVVPQHRERVFIAGFRQPVGFEFPSIRNRKPKLRDILDADPDSRYTLTPHLWRYLQDYAAKHKALGNGFGYGMANLDGVTRTLSARYYKDGSEILVPQARRNPRRLTPRECARLMGFPDSFHIPVSDTRAYKQFGNSVVVPVVESVAKALVATLKGKPAAQRCVIRRPKQLPLFARA